MHPLRFRASSHNVCLVVLGVGAINGDGGASSANLFECFCFDFAAISIGGGGGGITDIRA